MAQNSGDTTKYYDLEEIRGHNSHESLWVVLDNGVYDLTSFVHEHPGGEEVLMDAAGLDGTICFDNVGHSSDALERRKGFKIGEVTPSQWRTKTELKKEDDEYDAQKKGKSQDVIENYVVPGIVILVAFYVFFFY